MPSFFDTALNFMKGPRKACDVHNKLHRVTKFPTERPTLNCKHLHSIRICTKALTAAVEQQIDAILRGARHPIVCPVCGSQSMSMENVEFLVGRARTNQ